MKSLFIVCAAVACTLAASGCTTGDGGPATSPIDPFGTEPGSAGAESTGGSSAETIAELCAAACARIQAACPGAAGGTNCAAECSSAAPPGCETQFRTFVQCLAGAQILCSGGSFDAPQCDAAINAISTCASGTPGTGTAGGTGAAGATGTR